MIRIIFPLLLLISFSNTYALDANIPLDKKTLFVEHTVDYLQSKGRQGEYFNIGSLLSEYRIRKAKGKPLSRKQMSDLLNIGKDHIESLNKLSESAKYFKFGGNSREDIKNINTILGNLVGPKGNFVSALGNFIFDKEFEMADELLGPGEQRIAQMRNYSSIKLFNTGMRRVLIEAYNHEDKELKIAIDIYLSSLTGVTLDMSKKEILNQNRALNNQVILQENFKNLNLSVSQRDKIVNEKMDYLRKELGKIKIILKDGNRTRAEKNIVRFYIFLPVTFVVIVSFSFVSTSR